MFVSNLREEIAPTVALGDLLKRFGNEGHSTAFASVHQKLLSLHARCFSPPRAGTFDFNQYREDLEAALRIEERVLVLEDARIDMTACPSAENGGGEFAGELKSLALAHACNRHEFYLDYLPKRATRDDLAFYLAQESALDPRFDDFIALMQVGLAVGPKLELAENYWDEMGNGTPSRVHSVMFSAALSELGVDDAFVKLNLLPEALASGNLSAMLALRKPLVYRAMGNFAVTELLFPNRSAQLVRAWERLELSPDGKEYHREHIGVDARHAAGFLKNVIAPIVSESPALAKEIYWGAAARMNSSQRYLDAMLGKMKERREVRT